MKKLFIDTLGCQMNKSDTERIVGMLSHFDYVTTQNEYEADLFIVNTCAIRQLSVDKAYSRLGYWGKIKREKKEERDIWELDDEDFIIVQAQDFIYHIIYFTFRIVTGVKLS